MNFLLPRTKSTLESHFSIKISGIKHLLSADTPRHTITLMDTHKGKNTYIHLKLTTTPCQYGGFRYWFLCEQCDKRVGVIYERNKVFCCRHCIGLGYKSQRLQSHQRQAEKLMKLYKKMGWQGLENLHKQGIKPKYMKMQNFEKICGKINQQIEELNLCYEDKRAKKFKKKS